MFSRFSNIIRTAGQRILKTPAPETKTITIPRENGESPVHVRIPEGKKVAISNTKEGMDFTMDDGTQILIPHKPLVAESKFSTELKEISKGSLDAKPADILQAEAKKEAFSKPLTLEDTAKTAQQIGTITDTAVKVTTVATGIITGAGVLAYSTIEKNGQRGDDSVANQQTKLELDSLPQMLQDLFKKFY